MTPRRLRSSRRALESSAIRSASETSPPVRTAWETSAAFLATLDAVRSVRVSTRTGHDTVSSNVAGAVTTTSDHPPENTVLSIRWVLFDLDNTLLDRDAGFLRFCRELYHTSGVMSGTHSEEEAVTLMAEFDAAGMRSRQNFFDDVIRRWPGVFSSVSQAIDVYLASYPEMLILEPRTRALLEDLQEAGIPTAIVTNGGTTMQNSKIDASGLRGLVDAVVISEEAGVAKPDPRIFERAVATIGAVTEETLFVGDNPEADILGAKGMGFGSAWLHLGRDWEYAEERPDHILDDVSDVRAIVFPDGR